MIPKPKDWPRHISIAGFYFLSLGSSYQPAPDLAEFLAAGPPPVYIGFGSIVVDDPNAMTKLIFEAVKLTGQRALVSKGWGGLGADDLDKPDNVFMLGNCPHDWLFQKVSCVVHHGGAGTTAAGVALGRPTVIVPFFGDQPFWGAMIARAGAGPYPIPFKELTAQGLADAITFALKPETLERAKELGDRIRDEKGCESGAASFHARLQVDKLRCTLAPGRVAVWRVKTKGSEAEGVRLSALAAAVLANEGVLDMDELELYRPCEYQVDEHPCVSSFQGANPVLGTIGSLTAEVLRWPCVAGRALGGLAYEPYKGAKADGWRGFGKGVGRGIGHFFFPRKGFFITPQILAVYKNLKKKYGSGTLSFILAVYIAQGFEELKESTPEERQGLVRRWNDLVNTFETASKSKKKENRLSLQSWSGTSKSSVTVSTK